MTREIYLISNMIKNVDLDLIEMYQGLSPELSYKLHFDLNIALISGQLFSNYFLNAI